MKRKDLLLVTFLLSQTVPLWAMDPPERRENPSHSATSVLLNQDPDPVSQVKQLQRSLLDVQQAIAQYPAEILAGEKIFFMGQTGHGKSTLINFLVGNKLFVDDQGRLDTETPLKGSEIGHSSASRTSLPSFCVGPNNIILCDLAGFGDSGGPEKDIINAYAAHKLFSKKCKFLFAVSEPSLKNRAGEFLTLLNTLTKTIPVEQLEGSLALVITQQGAIPFFDPHRKLQELITGGTRNLTEDVKRLLIHLTDADHIHLRIPFFPYPKVANDSYDNPDSHLKILESIHALTPLVNPKVKLQLPDGSLLLIRDLTHSLNKEVESSLHLMRPTMMSLCKAQAENWLSPESLETLKTQEASVRMSLRVLDADVSGPIETFVVPLNLFIIDPELRKQHLHSLTNNLLLLSFLKEFSPDVSYSKAQWTDVLQTTLEDLHKEIDDLSINLGNLITFHVNSTIHQKVTNFCSKVLETTDDEEKKVRDLKEVLTILKIGMDALPYGTVEKMTEFANSFHSFFGSVEENVVIPPMKALNELKTIKNIHYPGGEWSEALEPSLTLMQSMITDREQLLQAAHLRAAQEEAARVERERAEEAARVERERVEAERQRLIAEHQAREESARREREEAERRAEEYRQTHAAEIERQRLAREEEIRQAHAQFQEEIARHQAQAEADRRAHDAEVARREAEAEEHQHQIRLAANVEAERQRQETARIEARLAEAVQTAAAAQQTAQQAAAIAQQTVQQLAAQQAEANRKAEEDRKALEAANSRAAAAEAARVAAEKQRVLGLRNGKVSKADYDLLPENQRRTGGSGANIRYYKKALPKK